MSGLDASELFTVKDMVFVITGGGTGIGAMMANALDINGAFKVYIIGRRFEKLQDVAANAVNFHLLEYFLGTGDITSKESLMTITNKIRDDVGFVNVVIANSGIGGPSTTSLPTSPPPNLVEYQKYLWAPSMEDFNQTFLCNTTAAFYTLISMLSLLDAGNSHPRSPASRTGVKSQFIATSSIGAFSRKPGMGYAYAASKAGLVHLVKQLSTNLVGYKIRCNCFAPGIYPSDMSINFLGGKDATQEGSIPDTIVPATRIGTEQDAAGAILFLCSRAGGYINGNVIISDGGRLSITPATY